MQQPPRRTRVVKRSEPSNHGAAVIRRRAADKVRGDMTTSTDAASTQATSNRLMPSGGLTEKLFEELLTELRS